MTKYPWPVPALASRYRWLAAERGPHDPAAQAARGRMKARLRQWPGTNDESPAAIAAHRALDREGYMNRSARKHRWEAHRELLRTAEVLLPRRGTL